MADLKALQTKPISSKVLCKELMITDSNFYFNELEIKECISHKTLTGYSYYDDYKRIRKLLKQISDGDKSENIETLSENLSYISGVLGVYYRYYIRIPPNCFVFHRHSGNAMLQLYELYAGFKDRSVYDKFINACKLRLKSITVVYEYDDRVCATNAPYSTLQVVDIRYDPIEVIREEANG